MNGQSEYLDALLERLEYLEGQMESLKSKNEEFENKIFYLNRYVEGADGILRILCGYFCSDEKLGNNNDVLATLTKAARYGQLGGNHAAAALADRLFGIGD